MITTSAALVGALLVIASIPDAASYTKYGRTCKDIGCRSDEVCVMAEDPCSLYQRDNCGRYPTCTKASQGPGCKSMICGPNEDCRTEDGVAKCVKRMTGNGYESAGVSYVNGEKVVSDDKSPSDSNPYAHANAPPPPPDPVQAGSGYHVNTGSNLGYPAYPPANGGSGNNNAGSRIGWTTNNGYPAYPSSNQGTRGGGDGYPPYPPVNRMPAPGYPGQYGAGQGYPLGNPQGYPPAYPPQGYPQQNSGAHYPAYPKQQVIYQNPRYRGNAAATLPSGLLLAVACVMSLLRIIGHRS